MKKPQQMLCDGSIAPASEIISEALGKANTTYVKFLAELKNYGISLLDWRYYNDGKAWLLKGEYRWTTSRGTDRAKTIFWLSVWDGFFKISFSFPEKMRPALLSLPLSPETCRLIESTEATGKTVKSISVIFDVQSDCQLGDIFTMVNFRKENT